MAENKKSFIAYSDWKETFDSLPDEYAGKLIKHIFSYVNDENPTTDDFVINSVFANIKNTLKRDLDKWDKQISQRSEAGKKSAEARARKAKELKSIENQEVKNSTSVETRTTKTNEQERNSTDNVSVSVSDSVILLEKETKEESEQSSDNTLLFSLDVTNQSQEVKLTKALFDLFRKNQQDNGVTVFTKYDKSKLSTWLPHIEKMINIDGVTYEDFKILYTWLGSNFREAEFWKKNILSTQKLREQYPKLQQAINSDAVLANKLKQQQQNKFKNKTMSL